VNSYSHGTQLPSIPRALLRGIVERDALSELGIETEIVARRSDEDVVDAGEVAEFIEQGSQSARSRSRGSW
jgi:hypothetical protein